MTKIKVLTDQELEGASVIVCALASSPAHFEDDQFSPCCECQQMVRYRPHAPTKPKRICLRYAMPMIEERMRKGDFSIATSDVAMKEFRRHGMNS
jgi:hypothetical protein